MKETVQAINDLTRVVIALSGKFESRADAIRKLSDLGIPPTRIAAILAMEPKDVTSVISKAKKTKTNGK
ncbi:hypothetical protein [Anaeromyxobacter diazotrophicus]|uniref:Uncharacterized protein n=1 Tax=Anaeromyxobacter diazotrophicus TaxID=2590199 RepID=A0A7I9VQ91_9BACT|nr:hypothetical protein [Anaeromyxobacter diazotrophicus]GEJ58418.1 hypothetical protein AMYX_31590 [Anaeromyxobacter diazotrophicus]